MFWVLGLVSKWFAGMMVVREYGVGVTRGLGSYLHLSSKVILHNFCIFIGNKATLLPMKMRLA